MEPNSQVSSEPSLRKADGPIVLFKSSWEMFKKHWKVLFLIILLPQVILLISQILSLTFSFPLMMVAVILAIAGIILMIASYGAIINGIHKLATGLTITKEEQFRIGFKYFWGLILLFIIMAFVSAGSFLLLIIPGIVVVIYTTFYLFTRIVDDKRGFESFVESYRIVKGRWWGVLGRILFLGLISILVTIVLSLVTLAINLIFGLDDNSFASLIVSLILGTIVNSALVVFGVMYMYKMYSSLKETRLLDVPGKTFKGWLVAFLVLGIVLPIVLFTLFASFMLALLVGGFPSTTDFEKIQNQIESQMTPEQVQKFRDFQQKVPNSSDPSNLSNPTDSSVNPSRMPPINDQIPVPQSNDSTLQR